MPKNSYVGYHSPTQGVWNTWFGYFHKGRDYPNGAIKDSKALLKACLDACVNEEVGKDAKYLYAAAPGLSEAIRLLVKINRGIVLESVPPVVLTEINLEDWNVPVRNDYSDGFLFANYWLAHGYHLKVNPKKSKEEQAAAVAAAPMPNPYMQQTYQQQAAMQQYQQAQAAQQLQQAKIQQAQAQLLGQYQQAIQNQLTTQQGTAAPIASSTWTGRKTP